MFSLRKFFALAAIAGSMFMAVPAQAATITFSGSDSNGRVADAVFTLTGTTLTVLLENKSLGDAPDGTYVLGGIAFNSTGLTPVSASLPAGTTSYYGSTSDPGAGWDYKSGISFQGYTSGISAVGLGIFGEGGGGVGNFSASPVQVDGLDYALLPKGFNLGTTTANSSVTNHGPLFDYSISFTLTTAAGFTLDSLGSTVKFQYGTATDAPTVTGTSSVPEPASIVVWGLLGLSAVVYHRRRKAA